MWGNQGKARAESANLLRGVYLYTPYQSDFVAKLKDLVPHDLRLWESDHKRWYVFESYAEQAVRLARSYWPDIDLSKYDSPDAAEQKRQQERTRREYQRQHSGYSQGSSNQGQWGNQGQGASSDHATLYVTADAPAEVIKAAYKALAIMYHPDRGGDTARMQAVNAAFDRLKKAGKA